MKRFFAKAGQASLIAAGLLLSSCTQSGRHSHLPDGGVTVLSNYRLTGAISPVHDPSIARQGNSYYLFSTDAGGNISGHLPIRCSTDRVTWQVCGAVFSQIPLWVQSELPGIRGLWAPDISYFNGVYHLYYAGSRFGKTPL